MLQALTIAIENTSVVHGPEAVAILVAKGCTPIIDVLAHMLADGTAVVRWNVETGQTVLYMLRPRDRESWFECWLEVTDEGLRCIYRH